MQICGIRGPQGNDSVPDGLPRNTLVHGREACAGSFASSHSSRFPDRLDTMLLHMTPQSMIETCMHCHLVQAGLAGMLGMAGSANVQGEDQKKLDILANDVFISLLTVR
jgi:fructose-1,6-bisphosphatase